MKKKICVFLLCLLTIPALALRAAAKSPLVMDVASVMTTGEAKYLQEWSDEIGSTTGFDAVILTVPTLMGTPIEKFADDFYDNNRYGEDGVLFLLDMDTRQWYLSTSGAAIDALSNRDYERIENDVIPYFSQGRYYDGFCRFLDILPELLDGEESGINLLISILAGASVAGIVLLVMRSTMNTKKPQRSAVSYETDGTYHLRTHQDLFLYSNISKRPRPQNNSSGGAHRSSSGRSHGGRGGRF